MKVWMLSPIDKEASGKKGYIRIRAPSEERARQIAELAFEHGKVNKFIHDVNWAELNWTSHSEVKCEYEADDIESVEGILDVE
ncbi:MAG: hypothetical protein AB7I18_09815 [Candidatus Berkiella sp.]